MASLGKCRGGEADADRTGWHRQMGWHQMQKEIFCVENVLLLQILQRKSKKRSSDSCVRDKMIRKSPRWEWNRKKGHQIPGTAPGVTDLSDATETSHQWQLVNPAGEEEAQDFCRGTLWGLCKFTWNFSVPVWSGTEFRYGRKFASFTEQGRKRSDLKKFRNHPSPPPCREQGAN